ncbi:hypothetical protein KJ903_02345, partial [Patescibacteria group bacterium]|nr:hypothetical protein [Patescibacteria group bacterium]
MVTLTKTLTITTLTLAFCLSLSLVASASTANSLQPASTITYSETVVVPSIRIGSQGTGGVTYFNGSIVNSTTGSGGVDNPVTFGDNVRIDGGIQRGTSGAGD